MRHRARRYGPGCRAPPPWNALSALSWAPARCTRFRAGCGGRRAAAADRASAGGDPCSGNPSSGRRSRRFPPRARHSRSSTSRVRSRSWSSTSRWTGLRPCLRRGGSRAGSAGGRRTTGRRRASAWTTAPAASSSWKGATQRRSRGCCATVRSIPTSGSSGTSAGARCARRRCASVPTGRRTASGRRWRRMRRVRPSTPKRPAPSPRPGPARLGTSRSTVTSRWRRPWTSVQGGGSTTRSSTSGPARRRGRAASGCASS